MFTNDMSCYLRLDVYGDIALQRPASRTENRLARISSRALDDDFAMWAAITRRFPVRPIWNATYP